MHNNPAAFPRVISHEEGDYGKVHYAAEPGMTLRDWFAGHAIEASWALAMEFARSPEEPETFAARQAYAIADAMLAERANRPSH